MKIKIGKYKNCVKKLIRYGFTEEAAKITCGNVAIEDTDWEVEKKEEKPSDFDVEVAEEEKEVKIKKRKKTTAAGGKATKGEKGKSRPVHTEPRAMQMPLFQPWRSYKSEHRLQTKLERIQTSEQKFLTMEQLLKRAEYALAIKKKDAEPFMVYAIPEELWDQAIGMGKPLGTTKKGYPIVEWKRLAGGQAIPIVMTEKGVMPESEAIKSGAKAGGGQTGPQVSISEKLGKRAEQRIERKGEIPISSPRTEAQVEAEKGSERDKQFDLSMENLTERTLEIRSPWEHYRERREETAKLREKERESLRKMTPREIDEMSKVESQIRNITSHPSYKTIGENVQVQINYDEYAEEDLWALLKNELNFATQGRDDNYKYIDQNMGRSPYQYQEAPNHLAQFEAIQRIRNMHVLYDFAYHTSNHYLKKEAMDRLKSTQPSFYKKMIGDKTDPNNPQEFSKESARTFRTDFYESDKAEFEAKKAQKELYLSQSYTKYFEKDVPEKSIEKLISEERKTDKEFKASDPNVFQTVLEGMGLAEKGVITSEPIAEELPQFNLTGEKLTKAERKSDEELEKLTKAIGK